MLFTGQEDPSNPLMIQKYGCDLWSHWKWIEILKKKEIFTDSKVISLEYARLLDNGLTEIDADCTIEDGELLFSLYGISVRQLLDAQTKSSFINPSYIPKENQVVILCYHWDEKNYIHFAPGDINKNIILDPISRGSNTIKNGYLHSLRIYDIVSVI